MTVRPPPKVIVEKHEGYRTIIENGAFGGHRPGFFEWIIYTDELVADEALSSIPPDSAKTYIKRTIQCRIICDPVEAKAFHQWLSQHIAEYEKTFGKITVPGEVAEREKKPSVPTVV